jgi:hypothetical protein
MEKMANDLLLRFDEGFLGACQWSGVMIALPHSEMPKNCPDSACPHRVDSRVYVPYVKSPRLQKTRDRSRKPARCTHGFGLPMCVASDRAELINSKSRLNGNTFHTNSTDESSGRL